jgi:CxxC-x17-CxxC domain-containing protein
MDDGSEDEENESLENKIDHLEKKISDKITDSKKLKKSSVELFDAKCDSCSKLITVPFKPDGIRPVYCNDCFVKVKKEKEENKNKPIKLEDVFKTPEEEEIPKT